jgi:hypothetical protein
MKYAIAKPTNKESALSQQGLLYSPHDIVAELGPAAKALGIGITITPTNEIHISRWQFSRSFQNGASALRFLQEMGVRQWDTSGKTP